jgi:hypothetical protein
MDISVRHSLTYSTTRDVPVSVVARSLLANESLVIASIRILEKCVPGLEVSAISVKVAELSNSSPLREVLLATLFLTYQQDLVTEVPELIQKLTGYTVPGHYDALVTVLVLATALYTINATVERLMPGKQLKKLIEEYEEKKRLLSELIGVEKETLERYTAERIGADRAFFSRVWDFFAPAKLEPGAAILSNGGTVSADVIAEIPEAAFTEIPQSFDPYELRRVTVDIHRSDRDENKHGWRAVIESVSPRKVRMELAPDINPQGLWGKTSVVGDVLVIEGSLPDESIGPRTYQLLKLYER